MLRNHISKVLPNNTNKRQDFKNNKSTKHNDKEKNVNVIQHFIEHNFQIR